MVSDKLEKFSLTVVILDNPIWLRQSKAQQKICFSLWRATGALGTETDELTVGLNYIHISDLMNAVITYKAD